jgi:hypothetical protein
MNRIRTIFQMAWLDILQWRHSGRIGIIALFIIMIFNDSLEAIRNFILNVGISISTFIYPFLMTSDRNIVFVTIAAVVMFCDAPFLTNNQIYLITRMGKKIWFASKILYIIMGSIIYMLFTYTVSIVLLLPHVNLKNEWGKVLGTLCATNASNQFEVMLGMNYNILLDYKPFEAIIIELFLGILIVSFIGILLFVLNIYFKKEISILIVSGIVVFGMFANSLPYKAYFFSITSWINLTINTKYNYGVLPYQKLTFGILILLNLFLVLIAWFGIKQKEI